MQSATEHQHANQHSQNSLDSHQETHQAVNQKTFQGQTGKQHTQELPRQDTLKDPDVLFLELQTWSDGIMKLLFSELSSFIRVHNLNFPRMMILFRLAHRDLCSVSDISKHMDITSPAASQLLDKLVESGFINRTENPDDRRVRNIEISQKGLELVKEIKEKLNNSISRLIQALPEEEHHTIAQSMHTLNVAIRSLHNHE